MHRFFIFNKQAEPNNIIIPTDDLLHQLTKVLRIRKNEKFVCIYEDHEYICTIEDNKISVITSKQFTVDKNRKITLVQGIPTNKKVSMILQKATELDVDHIVLWQAKRSTSKLSDFSKKEERLKKIIVEACEQSRRNDIPNISFIEKIDQLDFENSKTIVLYENESKKTFGEAIENCGSEDINIVIGPEGGFEIDEINQFVDQGSQIATLGKNILRTETAAIASLSVLVHLLR